MSCVYCDSPDIKKRTILEEELVWSFPTNIPITPGHALVCPKRHVAEFEDLTAEEKNAIFDHVIRLKRALEKSFGATGFNYAWNEHKVAGQSVPHFHVHIVPRQEGDAGIHEYEPRKFIYRPGERETSPEQELLDVAGLIRKNL